jgi:hypothetical protein
MDDVERNDDADGEVVGDGVDVAVDRSTVIGDEVVGAAVDEAASLDALGAKGSGSRRIPSVLTQ